MTITNDVRYVGVNDHQLDLFEGQYPIPNGMAYNSYVILDEKIAVLDTVDRNFTQEWMRKVQAALGDRQPDYLIVHHMEPDHSSNLTAFLQAYPKAVVVASAKTFTMTENFFGETYEDRRIVVGDGDTLSLGKHTLSFLTAPMVHWPEVIMTYDSCDKILFSADAFGKFGALDVEEPWEDEARRYYIGIVGKYGNQVQGVLKKIAGLEIGMICSLHGPALKENLEHYLKLYDTWTSYHAEQDGIVIAYTSIYGHTKAAVELLVEKLKALGAANIVTHDLARGDMFKAVEDAFRYNKLVLATTTYNGDIFPFMRTFIHHLTERNFQKRTVAMIENGSWAPQAARIMRKLLEECKDLTLSRTTVRILSALNDESRGQVDELAQELCQTYMAQNSETADKNNMAALFKIGYGLYVVTTKDGDKDNGCIVNSVTQLTTTPNRVAVNINKKNYTHDIVKATGIMNVNCLDVSAPFAVFQNYGFQTGRTADKFVGVDELRSDNGLRFLPRYINAFMSLKVENYVDMDTHGLFICSVTEARVISDKDTMTYAYYQKNVKPKPATEGKKGYVCTVCGWIYEGDPLPEDIVCPLCKHGAADFEPIKN